MDIVKGKYGIFPYGLDLIKRFINLFIKFSDSEQNKVKDLKNG